MGADDRASRTAVGRRQALKGLALVAGAGAIATGIRFGLANTGPEEDFRKGLTLHRDGRYGEAADLFGQAAKARPQDPLPLKLQGSAYANAGRYAEAMASYSQALDVSLDDPVIYLYRGEAELGLGLLDQAKRDFERARALANDDGRVASAADAHLRSLAVLQH